MLTGIEKSQEKAKEFADLIKNIAGQNLKMAALYGSIARDDFKPEISDINILFIVSDIGLEFLKKISMPVQKWRQTYKISPLFLTKEELEKSLDVFPIKFLEMKKHHKVITGEDYLKDIEIEWKFIRLRCEQEIRNMIMKLRRTFTLGSPQVNLLGETLKRFLPHLTSILKVVLEHKGLEHEEKDLAKGAAKLFGVEEKLLAKVLEKRGAREFAAFEELENFYQDFLNLLTGMVQVIEGMEG